jgi:hypothetical protein
LREATTTPEPHCPDSEDNGTGTMASGVAPQAVNVLKIGWDGLQGRRGDKNGGERGIRTLSL